MKSFSSLLTAALTALFVSGCATSTLRYIPVASGTTSRSGAPVSCAVEGMNSGVYLFYYIPLWTGNPRIPNENNYYLFRHHVNDKAIYRMFDVAAHRRSSARYEDTVITHRSTGIWTLWIFWKRSVHGRAVLVSEKPPRRKRRAR